jgi:hypothetical protein
MGIAWTITGIAFSVLVAAAMTALGYSPGDFVAAQICFAIAAAWLGGMTTYWVVKRWPLTTRNLVLAALSYVLAVVTLVGGFLYVAHREALAQASTPGNVTVGHDNNGNVCTSGANCTFTTSPAKAPDPPCPPGTGVCATGGGHNVFKDNTCIGIPHCIVLQHEHDDTATGNKSYH